MQHAYIISYSFFNPRRIRSKPCRSSLPMTGATLAEFTVIAIPLCLCLLLLLEAIAIFHTQHMIQYALARATREGSVQHAAPEKILAAFEQALLPLFGETDTPKARTISYERLQHYHLTLRKAHMLEEAFQLVIHRPNAALFQHYGEKKLPLQTGGYARGISNDYQAEKSLHDSKAHPLNRFQANVLILEVRYAKPPLLPGVSTILRTVATTFSENSLWQHGVYDIRYVHSYPMQSHAIEWKKGAKTPYASIEYAILPKY